MKIKQKQYYFFAFILLIVSVFSISPIFGTLIPVSGNIISFFFIWMLYLVLLYTRQSISMSHTVVILFVLICSLVNSIYWGDVTFKFVTYLVSFFLVLSFINKNHILCYTKLLTFFSIVLLIGSVIGFSYSLTGGKSSFSINNPDGRLNYFFLTTFSNTISSNLIRPSGIFDEPGALSFVVCLTVAFREMLKMPRLMSCIMLLLGGVTTSLAHIIFSLMFLCHIAITDNDCSISNKNLFWRVGFSLCSIIGLGFPSFNVRIRDY